jgi:hypothetical protein
MQSSTTNQFYLLVKDKDPILWDIYNPKPYLEPDLFWTQSDYCAKILQNVDRQLTLKGLTFYITFDQIDVLPSYGHNVVVVMTGDEGCHIPTYFHKVLAIFKPYGIKPFLGYNPLLHPSYTNLLSLLQYLKTWFEHLPGLLNFLFNRQKIRKIIQQSSEHNIFIIPLGYYKQLDLPVRDLESRFSDVFFAGSVLNDTYHKSSLKYWLAKWIKPPKSLAREQMLLHLTHCQEKHPELKTQLLVTSGFFSPVALDPKTYSEQIMDSKICLVPRGTSFETYRFFEAIRYGCIVISEALPAHWFYRDAPTIQIKHWKHLEQVINSLLENRELMQKKHRETLDWWHKKCSPEAVGGYIVEKLYRLKASPG